MHGRMRGRAGGGEQCFAAQHAGQRRLGGEALCGELLRRPMGHLPVGIQRGQGWREIADFRAEQGFHGGILGEAEQALMPAAAQGGGFLLRRQGGRVQAGHRAAGGQRRGRNRVAGGDGAGLKGGGGAIGGGTHERGEGQGCVPRRGGIIVQAEPGEKQVEVGKAERQALRRRGGEGQRGNGEAGSGGKGRGVETAGLIQEAVRVEGEARQSWRFVRPDRRIRRAATGGQQRVQLVAKRGGKARCGGAGGDRRNPAFRGQGDVEPLCAGQDGGQSIGGGGPPGGGNFDGNRRRIGVGLRGKDRLPDAVPGFMRLVRAHAQELKRNCFAKKVDVVVKRFRNHKILWIV